MLDRNTIGRSIKEGSTNRNKETTMGFEREKEKGKRGGKGGKK